MAENLAALSTMHSVGLKAYPMAAPLVALTVVNSAVSLAAWRVELMVPKLAAPMVGN